MIPARSDENFFFFLRVGFLFLGSALTVGFSSEAGGQSGRSDPDGLAPQVFRVCLRKQEEQQPAVAGDPKKPQPSLQSLGASGVEAEEVAGVAAVLAVDDSGGLMMKAFVL